MFPCLPKAGFRVIWCHLGPQRQSNSRVFWALGDLGFGASGFSASSLGEGAGHLAPTGMSRIWASSSACWSFWLYGDYHLWMREDGSVSGFRVDDVVAC